MAVVSFLRMAVASPERHSSPSRSPRRTLIAALMMVLVLVIALVVVVFVLSGVTLANDPSALAKVDVKPLGGTIEHLEALGPNGSHIPITVSNGRLTPERKLSPGTNLTVLVTVKRPGWIGWALGEKDTVHLTLTTPVATVAHQWMTVPGGSGVHVAFQEPVSEVVYSDSSGTRRRTLPGGRTVGIDRVTAADRHRRGGGRAATVGVVGRAHAGELVPALALSGDGDLPLAVEQDHAGRGDRADLLQAGLGGARRAPPGAVSVHPRALERTQLAHDRLPPVRLRSAAGRATEDGAARSA